MVITVLRDELSISYSIRVLVSYGLSNMIAGDKIPRYMYV